MRRSLSFSIGLTGLISILLVSLSPASASVLSKAAPSSPLAGMVAAQGRLVGAGGSAVPGARVILYAWPPDSIVSKLKDGQLVPVRTVGTALTTASGNYAVPVTSLAALQDSAAADGIVNLELIASTPTGFAAFSFPRRLIETAQGTALIGASGNAVQAVPQTTSLRLAHAAASSVPSIQCGQLVKVGTFGQRRTVVGAMYSHVPGVTMNFRYGSSQSSSLGVAISGSGNFGTWSASGTHSVSSSNSEIFPTFHNATSHRYRTVFVYDEFRIECGGLQTQATSWAAGATTLGATPPAATHCVTQQAGSTFVKDSTSAYTFAGGVAISGAIGVNLSAHTGYSVTAELRFSFSQTRSLCGTNAAPGGIAKRLVAGLG